MYKRICLSLASLIMFLSAFTGFFQSQADAATNIQGTFTKITDGRKNSAGELIIAQRVANSGNVLTGMDFLQATSSPYHMIRVSFTPGDIRGFDVPDVLHFRKDSPDGPIFASMHQSSGGYGEAHFFSWSWTDNPDQNGRLYRSVPGASTVYVTWNPGFAGAFNGSFSEGGYVTFTETDLASWQTTGAALDAKAAAETARDAANNANWTMNNIVSPKLTSVEGAIRDGSGNTVATIASWANSNAYGAYLEALAAKNNASWANTNADQAKQAAWDAATRSGEARDNAISASQNAINAKSAADSAHTEATNAKNAANTAANNASTAASNASTAATNAANASTNAQNASTNAQNAYNQSVTVNNLLNHSTYGLSQIKSQTDNTKASADTTVNQTKYTGAGTDNGRSSADLAREAKELAKAARSNTMAGARTVGEITTNIESQTYDVTTGKSVAELAVDAVNRITEVKLQGKDGATSTSGSSFTIIVDTTPYISGTTQYRYKVGSGAYTGWSNLPDPNQINVSGLSNGANTITVEVKNGTTNPSRATIIIWKL